MKVTMHLGEVLLKAYMIPLGVSSADVAKSLGVSSSSVSRLINEKSSVSTEMAIRLSVSFSTSPEQWLKLQVQWDINNSKVDVSKVFKYE